MYATPNIKIHFYDGKCVSMLVTGTQDKEDYVYNERHKMSREYLMGVRILAKEARFCTRSVVDAILTADEAEDIIYCLTIAVKNLRHIESLKNESDSRIADKAPESTGEHRCLTHSQST